MAYAFGFSRDITNLIYSMRDWRLEEVKLKGGTPSRLAMKSFTISNLKVDPPLPGSDLPYSANINTYLICVSNDSFDSDDVWILRLYDNEWCRQPHWHWCQCHSLDYANDDIDEAHGPQVHVVPRRIAGRVLGT